MDIPYCLGQAPMGTHSSSTKNRGWVKYGVLSVTKPLISYPNNPNKLISFPNNDPILSPNKVAY